MTRDIESAAYCIFSLALNKKDNIVLPMIRPKTSGTNIGAFIYKLRFLKTKIRRVIFKKIFIPTVIHI
ncbi:hypothetical protein J4234_05085 [Candidatus Woesearchaeota archaeon]|nr:hypothetical protein [Candidatus Woesearchaeota archaeon]